MLLKPTKLIQYSGVALIVGVSFLIVNSEKTWAQRDLFAAISYSPSKGIYGISNDKASQEQAVEEAKQNCGELDCDTTWVRNGCMVLGANIDNSKNYGFGYGRTLTSAENDALQGCTDCTIIRTLCTSR